MLLNVTVDVFPPMIVTDNTPTVSSGAKMIAYGDPNLQDVITGVENVDTMTAYINCSQIWKLSHCCRNW